MKPFTAIFLAACLFSLRPAAAQEAGAVPIPENTPAPTPPPSSPSLFPSETPPPVVTHPPRGSGPGGGAADHTPASQNPPVRTGKPAASTQNVADNVAYRKAKTKALRDEKVQQAWVDAQAAKNDPDKRAALKRYYTLLADRISKIDGSIKKLVDARLKESLRELEDGKVHPENAVTAER